MNKEETKTAEQCLDEVQFLLSGLNGRGFTKGVLKAMEAYALQFRSPEQGESKTAEEHETIALAQDGVKYRMTVKNANRDCIETCEETIKRFASLRSQTRGEDEKDHAIGFGQFIKKYENSYNHGWKKKFERADVSYTTEELYQIFLTQKQKA